MKILSIGTDRKLFDTGSNVLVRSLEYANKVQELHFVVFSLKKHGLKATSNKNLYIYPTNSSTRFSYILDALKISKKLIVKEGFNSNSTVVTCQDPFETGIVGYFLKRKFHLRLQIQVHTDFLSSYFKNSILNKIRVSIAKFLVPRADALRVVSSVISDSIKTKFPNLKTKVDVLPIFVDINKIISRQDVDSVSETKSEINILILSRFTKEKKIDTAIETLKNIIENGQRNVQLNIVGSGPEKDNIYKKINELNLEDNVRMLEWENDTISAFKKSDIFLLTSEYEGYGMTLIEAGASGVPIVTTKVGIAQTELFKDDFNSFVCPVGDVDCLSEKLMDLITNSDKRKLFKQRMQDNIRSVSISREDYVDKYVSLLKELINNA